MTGSEILALAAQNNPAQQQGSPMGMFVPLILIGLLFYFMIIRPQKREQSKVQQMRNSVKSGDKVKTIGGLYGTVHSVNEEKGIVTIQVDKTIKLEFDKNAIATVYDED